MKLLPWKFVYRAESLLELNRKNTLSFDCQNRACDNKSYCAVFSFEKFLHSCYTIGMLSFFIRNKNKKTIKHARTEAIASLLFFDFVGYKHVIF